MKTVGIICEYNPFHLGHKKQFDIIRQRLGEDTAIVCLMSGNFVQRGAPAIFDKSLRAQAAILSGADLVLELPVTYALSSAEGFAAGGVRILSGFCDYLCFGCESGTEDTLMETAKALYRLFVRLFGIEQSWGVVTGVRPVKLLRSKIAAWGVEAATRCVKEVNADILVLTAAGISNGTDVYNTIIAGADATGSSSGVAKAADRAAMVDEMIAAVRKAWNDRH